MFNRIVWGQCLSRSCNQFITGRNLPYNRVLEIIQAEEYLESVDIDLIRRMDDQYLQYNEHGKFRFVYKTFSFNSLGKFVMPIYLINEEYVVK